MLSLTLFLYIFIMLSTTLLAKSSQKFYNNGEFQFKNRFFILAFFIHWFFLAFTNIGTDHEQYIRIIEYDSAILLLRGSEVGFNSLCVLFYGLTKNAEICIFIFKTMALMFYYISFYQLRKKADFGLVFFAYNATLYLYSFYVIAHTLAISVTILAIVFAVNEKKWYWSLLLAILAFTIHSSAIIVAILLLGVIIIDKINLKAGLGVLVLGMGVAIYVLTNAGFFFQYAVSNVESFEQYAHYETSSNTGTGLFNYVLYFYIFIVLLLPYILSNAPTNLRNLAVVLFLMCFTSSIMGYFLGTARFNQYSLSLYGVMIPIILMQSKQGIYKSKLKIPYDVQNITWKLYLYYACYATLSHACKPQGISMLDQYVFFNPFS